MKRPHISQEAFGELPDGRSVNFITLSNGRGLEADITNYGGALVGLRVPDRAGKAVDVVLGFRRLEQYLSHPNYFGAITGRVAGRIPRGRFVLDGTEYALVCNHPPNHLHGGTVGLNKRLWQASACDDGRGVELEYVSPHGEEGYPGTVRFTVRYRLEEDNALTIEETVVSELPTPVSLTHHSYFNLAGEGSGNIDGHSLQVFADFVVPCDDDMTPLGRLDPVSGRSGDLRQPRLLAEVIPGLFMGHGDLYRLRDEGAGTDGLRRAARLEEPRSGRVMEVFTSHRFLQFYTGRDLDGTLTGKSGWPYQQRAGLCLECEGYPDAVNVPEMDDIVVRPGSPQKRITRYVFSNTEDA